MEVLEDKDENYTEFELEPEMELRFEVEKTNSPIFIELISGKAEIFGTEIVSGKRYSFLEGSKIAIFTWHGCTIHLWGKCEVAYIAKSVAMQIYLNIHSALEQMRQKADVDMNRGPRIMVVGPSDVGKSTLCKILLNYATRIGRLPVYVDLDVGQNDISIPGTIGALLINRPTDIEEGFVLDQPLVYHFGHKSPADNVQLYNLLVLRLAETVNFRSEVNNQSNISGVIINTCGWVRDGGYQCLRSAAAAFEVEVMIVLDQELLFMQLKKDMADFVKVILLPKSAGVVERSQKFRAEKRDQSVRHYFYGQRNSLCPHTFEVKFDDVSIYKIGAPILPDSMLPLGMFCQDIGIKPVPLIPNGSLENHVLSTSMVCSKEDDVVQTNVAGFVVISKVDMNKQTITLLSPEPRPFPWNTLLLMEGVTYLEM